MYAATPDPYCYKGTHVLINRLDIRDPEALEAFEADAVLLRADEPLPAGRFSPWHYRSVHRHLFQDVYTWAGRYRTVRISKGASAFCYPENIRHQMTALFNWLHQYDAFGGTADTDFCELGAHFLGELNAIHPFREGNGRTQMVFFAMLAAGAGHPLQLDRIEPEPFLAAMIEAFQGRESALAGQLWRLIR